MSIHHDDEARLVATLRKIEALFARPATEGERLAAEHARARVSRRLVELARTEPETELRFSLPDAWSRMLFTTLARRHGLRPYRYAGQRRTTVMVRSKRSVVEQTLWPEFEQFHAVLCQHLESVTRRIIARALGRDVADVEERPGTSTEIE